MDCEQVRDHLDAWALGALEPEEAAAVEAHLRDCPDCRALAAQRAGVASRLPEALAAASPHQLPPALRERVLDAVRATPADTMAVVPGSSGPDDTLATPPPVSLDAARDRRRLPRVPTWLGAAAAVLVLAVAIGWGFHLSQALGHERALREEFEGLVDRQEIVLEVIDSRNTVKLFLRPPEGSGSNAYGKLFTRTDMEHVVVMAARLPAPPDGMAYHLWLTRDGTTSLAGVLNTNEQGFGMLVFDAPVDGPVYEAVEVTLQPTGSTEKSGTTVLAWMP
jgi:hypothetical protein